MPRTKFKEINGKECIGELDYGIEGKDKKCFRINLIYLEEKYRGKGYGKAIMEDIIKKAKRLGCKKIVGNLTKPDYDYYSTYGQRRKFFENFGFELDKERYISLDLQNNKKA